MLRFLLCVLVWSGLPSLNAAAADGTDRQAVILRVATFNVQDVRTADLDDPDHPRLRRLAEVIQRLRPNVILLNEIAWDGPQGPGFREGAAPGQNGQRFADRFLASPQAPDLAPLRYRAYMGPVNTGLPSGFDLDRDGRVVRDWPIPGRTPRHEPPEEPCERGRAYGNDCWGFGTFPGQYGMALLVDERLAIEVERVRTFRLFPWDYMPGALLPLKADGEPWYDGAAREQMRLSSKSHWDVPVRLTNGAVVHFLCSHPTPPVFDGEERRNARRNRDEIRFWADYVENAAYIVDDGDNGGGLAAEESFVILGDLNADPRKGESFRNPIGSVLCSARRVNCEIVPSAELEIDGLEPTDTCAFNLRVDYVLPSRDLGIRAAGVYRHSPGTPDATFPSDHYPVWMELVVPPPRGPER